MDTNKKHTGYHEESAKNTVNIVKGTSMMADTWESSKTENEWKPNRNMRCIEHPPKCHMNQRYIGPIKTCAYHVCRI